MKIPTLADIEAAAGRLRGQAVETPLIESRDLGRRIGGRAFVKPETLQRTGSFKFRGAFNRLSQIQPAARGRGVVAFSSGNHAQGVAAAAAELAMPCIIVMPADAPQVKIDRTRGHGAEVVLYDRWKEDRLAIASRIAEERGATLVPPYEDLDIITGQGTLGLELCRQAASRDVTLSHVLVPCGGGGLTAGVASAVAAASPGTEVVTVEPAGFDDTRRSLEAGERLANTPGPTSICDAILTPKPGEITFAINSRLVRRGLAVSDDEVRQAVAYAFSELRLVVEPGGAVGLAALLAGRLPANGGAIAVVLSGGNISPELLTEIIL